MKRVHSRGRMLTHHLGPCCFTKRQPRRAFVHQWTFPVPALLIEIRVIVSQAQKNDGWHQRILNFVYWEKVREKVMGNDFFLSPVIGGKRVIL